MQLDVPVFPKKKLPSGKKLIRDRSNNYIASIKLWAIISILKEENSPLRIHQSYSIWLKHLRDKYTLFLLRKELLQSNNHGMVFICRNALKLMSTKGYPVEKVKTDLQIDEQIRWQEQGWKVQGIGLYFIFALVLAGAIGMFGDGIISKDEISNNLVRIEYERLYRFEARMKLTVETQNHNPPGTTVSFSNQYLKNFEIESIFPEPKENRSQDDHIQYFFEGSGPMNITFYLIPRTMGKVNGNISVNKNQFSINHYIFP